MTRICRTWLLVAGILLSFLAGAVRATNFVVSEAVANDSSSGRLTDSINDLELFAQGLFWTVPSSDAGAEFGHQGSVGILGYRLGPFSRPYYPQQGVQSLAFGARDNAYIYFTGVDGIHRKPINAAPGDPGLLIGGGWNLDEPGAVMLYNGLVYAAASYSVPVGNDGNLSIETFPAPGDAGSLQQRIQVANGAALNGDPGTVIKMGVVFRRTSTSNGLVPTGIALTSQGQLLNFLLDPNPFFTFSAVLLASDVADFAIRREQFSGNSVHLPYEQDVLYAAVGREQCAGSPRAKIVTVDPNGGAQSTVWTAPDGARMLSLGLDPEYLFVSTIQAGPTGAVGCSAIGDGVIRSKLSPAFPFVGGATVDPNWDPIEFNAGYNLRSDGQHLYFTYGQQVRRMPNNSPRIRLDIAAVGLEAIQAVQDFNNSVPLVQGKPTMVRGYARIADNSKHLNNLQISASLRGFKDGVELPGSPVFALNLPVVDTADDLPTLRTNLSRSFNIAVPANWLAPGALKLMFTVNPYTSLPENTDALGNNSVAATLTVVPGRQPSLVFKAMSSVNPNYDPNDPGSGFAEIIDRARSLMPVSDFHIYFDDGSVTKPVVTLFGVKGRSFTMPDDKTWALIWMTVAHMFSSDPGPDTHWVGTFPAGDSPFNGIGGATGVKLSDLMDNPPVDLHIPDTALDNTTVVRMSAGQGNSTNVWGSVVGGHTLAHELGHNYGRFHIIQATNCGAQAPDRPWSAYPADHCTLGVTDLNKPDAPMGYDRITGTLIPPDQAGDLMSYANSDWISPFTWNALVAAIPVTDSGAGGGGMSQAGLLHRKDDINPQPLPPHDPAFIWQGIIHVDSDTATVLPGYRLPRGAIDPAKVKESLDAAAALPANANYRLRLIGDPGAAPLDERPVAFVASAEGDRGSLIFVQALPDLGTATKMQVLSGGRVIAEVAASPNVPVIALGVPAIDSTNHTIGLTWTATDADNDPLLFTVQFSPDNGTNWLTLKVNDPDTALAIPTTHLHGGDQCVLRVLATDGFNTAVAQTDAFVLPKNSPTITISRLTAGQRVVFGSPQAVRVFAYDAEDGSIGSDSIAWSLSGGLNQSGKGTEPILADLPPGPCTLVVTATDSDGNISTSTLPFEVLPVAVPDSTAPILDGVGADSGYFAAATIRLLAGSAEPSVRLIHQGGILYASFNGLPLSDAGASIAATVLMAVDTDLSGGSAPGASQVAFGVDQDGLPIQNRGNGSGFAADTLAYDYHAVVSIVGTTWSAELAIPDTLLGGWNHNVGISFQLVQWNSISLPFGGPITVPGETLTWPYTGNFSGPSTWAGATFGTRSVPLANRPPSAVAGGPSVVALDTTRLVALDGTGSFDPDGDALTYTWTQLSGPTVDIQGANLATPTFAATVDTDPATLVFQLVVNDGQVDSDPATIQVELVPIPTVASGGNVGPVTVSGDGSTAGGQLDWPGAAGAVVTLQASTDLVSWVDIQTNSVGFLQTFAFSDADAGLYPQRFYRLHDWSYTPPPLTGGSALQFDGTSGLVTVPDNAAMDVLPITIMGWINTTQSTGAYPGIITKYEGGEAHGFALALDNGRFDPWYYADAANHVEELVGTGLDGLFVADGNWHHLAYVVGMTYAEIYIDGVLMNTLPWVGTPTATTTVRQLMFGTYVGGSGQPFAGTLEEVSIWNRELSQDSVRSLMAHPAVGTEDGLIGLWHFDEADGSPAADSSGHGNDGAITGGATHTPSTAPLH